MTTNDIVEREQARQKVALRREILSRLRLAGIGVGVFGVGVAMMLLWDMGYYLILPTLDLFLAALLVVTGPFLVTEAIMPS